MVHGAPEPPAQVSPPEFALSDAPVSAIRGAQALVIAAYPDGDGFALDATGDELAEALDLDLLHVLGHAGASGRSGAVATTVTVHQGEPVAVLTVGVGEGGPRDYRRAGAATGRALVDREMAATSVLAKAPDSALEPFVVGLMLGSFGFDWRSGGPQHTPIGGIALAGMADGAEETLERALAVGGAGWLARRLATTPSNLKTPTWLAAQAQLVADDAGLACEVWDEQELARRGMGGLLAVGRASASPPRLIRLEYTPPQGGRRVPHVVLVGKGITFDTGGLSIKPAQSMTTMKRDMSGGAVVIAVLGALRAVGCPVRVTGLVPAAENAVGGDALRPGDVVTHYGGRTSEVTNTDAEGRLVLADALAWAVDELEPGAIVDVATLTGAMKVALGQDLGGVFANDDALADSLSIAGGASGEPLWRMPLAVDYQDRLRSTVADADNGPGGPGAITAALFLEHFIGGIPWAHLDVASAGDSPSENFEWTQGPTGFGARALLSWLGTEDPLAGVGAGADPK